MSDDQRKHGGTTPGMVPGRGHERHEEPVRLNHPEPGEERSGMKGKARDDMDPSGDHGQDSALGGHVATTGGTGETLTGEED